MSERVRFRHPADVLGKPAHPPSHSPTTRLVSGKRMWSLIGNLIPGGAASGPRGGGFRMFFLQLVNMVETPMRLR